jgi:CHRD domain
MNKFVTTALMAAFASGTMLAGPAFADANDAVHLVANMDGSSVLRGGEQDGSGTFAAVIDVDQSRLCYDLNTANIGTPTFAHIHEGSTGDEGRPLLNLRVDDDHCSTLDSSTMQALIANPSDFYVDVLTSDYHAGAIRGQLAVDAGASNGDGDGNGG